MLKLYITPFPLEIAYNKVIYIPLCIIKWLMFLTAKKFLNQLIKMTPRKKLILN